MVGRRWRLLALLLGVHALHSFVEAPWLAKGRSGRAVSVQRRQQGRIAEGAPERTEVYKLLKQRDHVLRRHDMYIGPVDPREEQVWVISRKKIVQKSLTYSLGLVQIFNEILVNAIDRQYYSSMSEIRVEVDRKEGVISVWNNGGAIPVAVHKSGLYVPTMVFGEFMSGSNFDDSGVRFTGGRNGVGAKATNVFSSFFEVTVDDPGSGQRFYQRWEDNMGKTLPHEISPLPPEVQEGSVKITFKPDLKCFGLSTLNMQHMQILRSRTFDAAACTGPHIQVSFNNEKLNVQNFQEFSAMVLGKQMAVTEVRDDTGAVRAEVAVGFAGASGFAAYGFVNGMRCCRGTHVRAVTADIVEGLASLAGKVSLTAATVRQYLHIVVKVLVDSPDFDSQTKTQLTTTRAKLGFELRLPSEFIQEIAELGVLDAALHATEATRKRGLQRALGAGSAPSLAKLEDATLAGRKGKSCTLILTEGDSAKALAVAGLAQVGRERFGVFPLKGKLLNVRSATDKQLKNNEEIKNLMHILGLRWGQVFESEEEVTSLRYQQVMIFSDQDLDGHHIAGLVLNFFASLWPSLLEMKPDFVQRFATPLVKVFPRNGGRPLEFFCQGDFDDWQRDSGAEWPKSFRAKYYKGLATSTREEALQYFADMDKHVIDLELDGESGTNALAKVFEPARADDRKLWISRYDPSEELNYSEASASYEDFLDKQLVHFSAYDCVRSIPLLLDGLKPSQRKVLWWAMRNLKTEKRVSQIVGLVSSATSYHHGEESLVKVIVRLAQDFVGTNNVNLLEPKGMFGTRLNGPNVHGSARYIETQLTPLVPYIFRREDVDVMEPQMEEGHLIEPASLLPIFPLVLVNGFQGIGTGWSTQGPNYDPLAVVAGLESLIQGKRVKKLAPTYRGFRGEVEWEDGKWYSKGIWTVHEVDDLVYVEITELPIGVWTEDFVAMLEKKASQNSISMKIFKCHDHDDQSVHLLVAVQKASQRMTEKALEKFLALKKPLTESMWLYNQEEGTPALQYFKDPREVLQTFYGLRRPFYARRKEVMVQKISHQVLKLRNQVKCVEMCKEGSLELSALCGCGLEEAGFDRAPRRSNDASSELEEGDEGFEYILTMPLQRFGDQGAQRLRKQLAEAEAKLERLEALEVDEMWLQDLASFREEYQKVYPQRPVKEIALTASDRKKAQAIFKKELQRVSRVAKTKTTQMPLEQLTIPELKKLCAAQGLLRGGRKQELIDRLKAQ